MQVPTVAWPGGSGKNYTFDVYPISSTFNPGYTGNYIFAKQVNNGWLAVYIGEGILKDRIAAHISDGCVAKNGATHIHIRINNSDRGRFDDETDLLAGSPEAYAPNGCNEKRGG